MHKTELFQASGTIAKTQGNYATFNLVFQVQNSMTSHNQSTQKQVCMTRKSETFYHWTVYIVTQWWFQNLKLHLNHGGACHNICLYLALAEIIPVLL